MTPDAPRCPVHAGRVDFPLRRTLSMRALCTWLSATILVGCLVCLAPGCGGGTSELEKTPEVKQNPTMADMPGYDDMQKKLKEQKKIK
jgi:hypothetical protein